MSSVQDFFYRALNLSASDNKMRTVPGGIFNTAKGLLNYYATFPWVYGTLIYF